MVDFSKLENISPLYSYWKSDQDDIDERNRLLIANKNSKALSLFENEPYKWEVLFQSIIREIINGDQSSIKGMKIILNTLSFKVRKKVLNDLLEKNFINEDCYLELKNPVDINSENKKNFLRFIRIFFAIFINPYGIVIRRKKTHIYEKTGFLFNYLRNL